MIWLNDTQVIALHRDVVNATGGSGGLRVEGLLQSALAAPLQTYDDTELFPTLTEKAARLAFGLTRFHPFVDGNKRIGVHAMLVVLALNGIKLTYPQKELSDLFLSLAAGEIGYDELLAWIDAHNL